MCGGGAAYWAASKFHWNPALWQPWDSAHSATGLSSPPSHLCVCIVRSFGRDACAQVGILRHRVRRKALLRVSTAAAAEDAKPAAAQPALAAALGAVVPAYCTELASHALSVADTATSTLTSRATVLSAVSAPLLDPVAAWRAVAATRKRSVRVLELCDELSGLLTQEGMWVTLYKTGGITREPLAPAAVPLSVWDALTRPVGFGADDKEEHGNGAQQDFWVDSSSDEEDGERPGARLREGCVVDDDIFPRARLTIG